MNKKRRSRKRATPTTCVRLNEPNRVTVTKWGLHTGMSQNRLTNCFVTLGVEAMTNHPQLEQRCAALRIELETAARIKGIEKQSKQRIASLKAQRDKARAVAEGAKEAN